MELLLILIYVSICYVTFKVFRIPVNQWSLATAALGGIIGIALLLLIMNYNHPFTKNARIYFSVTPVLPTVRGRVIEVPVKENAPLKEGEVLFRIDPKPFEYVVEQKKAELADAEWDLEQTVTRAPGVGFVTQVALRPGVYVVPAPLRPVMVFVNTDVKDQALGAAFQQNSLQRVKAGDDAEVAFDAVPGRVFKGKVRLVLDAIAAGQIQPTGALVDCA